MNEPKVVSVGKSDVERAAELKAALRRVLDEHVCPLLNSAQKDGIKLSFNISPDAFGRSVVAAIEAVKPL